MGENGIMPHPPWVKFLWGWYIPSVDEARFLNGRPTELPANGGGRGKRGGTTGGRDQEAEFPGDSGRRHGVFRRTLLRRRRGHAKPGSPCSRGREVHPGVFHGALRAFAKLPADRVLRAADGERRDDAAATFPATRNSSRTISSRWAIAPIIPASGTCGLPPERAAWASTTPTPCWTSCVSSRKTATNSTASRFPSPAKATTVRRRSPTMRCAF